MNHVSKNKLHPKSETCCLINKNHEVIQVYNSFNDAARKHNIFPMIVYKTCSGEAYMINGFKFRYFDKEKSIYLKTRFDIGVANIKGRYGKPIKCLETGHIAKTQKEMEDMTGVSQGSISQVLRGVKESVNGLHFEYI